MCTSVIFGIWNTVLKMGGRRLESRGGTWSMSHFSFYTRTPPLNDLKNDDAPDEIIGRLIPEALLSVGKGEVDLLKVWVVDCRCRSCFSTLWLNFNFIFILFRHGGCLGRVWQETHAGLWLCWLVEKKVLSLNLKEPLKTKQLMYCTWRVCLLIPAPRRLSAVRR